MKILNYGSLNIDHVYRVNHIVVPGETLAAHQYERCLGGKGLNQSIALARSGLKVWHAGQIGPDGAELRAALERENIDTSLLHAVETPTGHALIQVDAEGQNSILLFGGANQCQQRANIDAALVAAEAGDVLLCQNEINEMEYLTRAAREKGMRIALNPSPMNEGITKEMIRRCEWIFVNETEAEALSGGSATPEEQMDVLCNMFPDVHIIMTLGSRGALTGKGKKRCQGKACQVKAVDTTAAGDTFTGYYLAEYLQSGDENAALAVAATASGLSVMRKGASPSIPRKEEVVVGRLPWRE